jgi:hypothetical protein
MHCDRDRNRSWKRRSSGSIPRLLVRDGKAIQEKCGASNEEKECSETIQTGTPRKRVPPQNSRQEIDGGDPKPQTKRKSEYTCGEKTKEACAVLLICSQPAEESRAEKARESARRTRHQDPDEQDENGGEKRIHAQASSISEDELERSHASCTSAEHGRPHPGGSRAHRLTLLGQRF